MNTINYTSIEQSDTLLKHGLSLETADMYYEYIDHKNKWVAGLLIGYSEEGLKEELFNLKQYKPCWSVGALLEALPGSFSLFNDGTYWWCEWSGTDSDYIDFTTGECNTAIEALCKTVVWILENC